MTARRWLVTIVVLLLAFFSARDLLRLDGAQPWRQLFDFVDFYCAGEALDVGADPYRYEPLHTCEHQHTNGSDVYNASAVAVPAPQPPYDLAAYGLLARLSFPAARAIDVAATVAALVICVVALAVAGVPIELALFALLLQIGFVELDSGQIAVFAFAPLVLCGTALVKRHDRLAGFFGALVAIEPHVALPVCAALLLFVPRARITLVATLVALALITFAAVGIDGVREYLFLVLPEHAFAEAANPLQYSATYAAWFLGVPRADALVIGSITYVAAAALGVYFAAVRRDTTGRARALMVFLPAMTAITGGTFIHDTEILFAIPAALVVALECRGVARAIAAAALCFLAVPWVTAWGIKRLFAISLLSCAVLLARLRVRVVTLFGMLAVVAASLYWLERYPRNVRVGLPPGAHYSAQTLVQSEWIDVMKPIATHDLLWFAIKVPVWAALAALVVLAALRLDASRQANDLALS